MPWVEYCGEPPCKLYWLLFRRLTDSIQFLSHDGITTFTELLDALQNVYNVGYDLAVTLATLGVGLDGDVVTGKLSIGCDATSRTSATGDLLGDEVGLNGHNVRIGMNFQQLFMILSLMLPFSVSKETHPSPAMITF